jgi:inosine-uridine nucleoside N-ribohydrolase
MKKVLMDCDPGHDDMVAILLAVASEEIDLLGITTVAGNQTGDKTSVNALKVLTLINRNDIPVARGFDKPLIRELVTAPAFHGVSGLDGADLPEPEVKLMKMHAVDFIIEKLMQSKGGIYLVPTGPLTNIAVALLKEPRIKEKIERIVLMGGGVFDSNTTPAAEFNIYVDPEAAKIVFESGVPITMVGLDVTDKAIFSFEDIDTLAKMNGKVSRVVAPLLKFFGNANKEIYGFNGAPLHDALAVSTLIDPSVAKTEFLHVDIETKGEFTRGETVADVYHITGEAPNVDVAMELNLARFKEIIFTHIRRLDESLED